MNILIRHVQPVPADIAALPIGNKNYAAVTFDDGIENAVGIRFLTQKEKYSCDYFRGLGNAGRQSRWEYRGANGTLQEKAMSETQLKELRRIS